MPIEITDPADERVRDYFALTDVALRTKVEPARGLYLAESEKVIRRALAAGHRPRSFLMAQRWLTDLSDLVVKIPMAGGVDSLNMAAASAVAIWALRPLPKVSARGL